MNLGASRPAHAGSLSPVWEMASKNSLAWGYRVPDGVNGTGSNVSPALFTAVLYMLALCRMRDSTCDIWLHVKTSKAMRGWMVDSVTPAAGGFMGSMAPSTVL